MVEVQPDKKLAQWIGVPDPPHKIALSRPKFVMILAGLIVGLAPLFAITMAVEYFVRNPEGRGLVADTALAAGMGERLPDARVVVGDCVSHYSTGRFGSSGWDCPITVTHGAERTELSVDLYGKEDAQQHLGAGRVFGVTGLYWPGKIIARRWMSASLLIFAIVGLLALPFLIFRSAKATWRLSYARNGRACVVDLLIWSGRPWFTFIDDHGRRHFQRAPTIGAPLVLDGVATTGLALVAGRAAVLLRDDLSPMELGSATRVEILARAAETRKAASVRPRLPPLPGDPATLAGRIAEIEATLADAHAQPALSQLYRKAWRLVWDCNDPDIAKLAFEAREQIAKQLGPEETYAALDAIRRECARS